MKKSATTPKRPKKNIRPTLHGVLGSLNYTGTVARVLLVGMLTGVYFTLVWFMSLQVQADLLAVGMQPDAAVSGSTLPSIILGYLAVVIGFALFDLLYVTTAIRYPLNRAADKLLCFLTEIIFLTYLFLPVVSENPVYTSMAVVVLVLLLPLFIFSIRLLIGVALYNKKEAR